MWTSAIEDRLRPKHPLRFDDPHGSSLLAFLTEGYRLFIEAYQPSPWGPLLDADPAAELSPAERNLLEDHRATHTAVHAVLRRRAIEMLAAARFIDPQAQIYAEAEETIIAELVNGWSTTQLAIDVRREDETSWQNKVYCVPARAIAGFCELLSLETGRMKITPFGNAAATVLNLGIPKRETGLAGRHILAGYRRWTRDLLQAVNRYRDRRLSGEDFVDLEYRNTTMVVHALLVLWLEAPKVERFRGVSGVALARSIAARDGIVYRIGKAAAQPLPMRALCDLAGVNRPRIAQA
ncbi:hypothetical protein N7E70_007145 [Aminobacter sp. NyZ550]|uniref:hypothetical protein n=1 Tax=Aminobacter sp. NyZ550 TaxID=2979870 RepID=UPI0021D5AF4D|nr:hypothetical protein [Aminobacter sp. NyZ550]WAX96630.1 hypothetical protein N7E70_007145 [Aminobacter sp. NyZ550]